ncbi:7096_t:CDS:1, partial [Paraglomus brasilianum]
MDNILDADHHHSHEIYSNIINLNDPSVLSMIDAEDVHFLKERQSLSTASLPPDDMKQVAKLVEEARKQFERINILDSTMAPTTPTATNAIFTVFGLAAYVAII